MHQLSAFKNLFFVVGTAFLILVAFHNTIVQNVSRFWGFSGDFWQTSWDQVFDFFGRDNRVLHVVGGCLWLNVSFWVPNMFLIFMDLTGKPKLLTRYKIQPDANTPLDWDRFFKALLTVLFNTTVVHFLLLLFALPLYEWRGASSGSSPVPTFQRIILELAVFSIFEEFGFYYSHRLFHQGSLYRLIHKKHHEWTASIGIVALYSHPIEYVVSNMIPAMMGPFVMGSHPATIWLWTTIGLITTTISHCGYHLPFLPSPEAHDYHHLKFNQNYGVMGWLDDLHETNTQFKSSIQYKRHFLSVSSVPLTTSIPDGKKGVE